MSVQTRQVDSLGNHFIKLGRINVAADAVLCLHVVPTACKDLHAV